jgi:hypothetical protein
MEINKCVNCGKKPKVKKQKGYWEYVLSHENDCYPTFMLETHQHTRNKCIKEWNEFNKTSGLTPNPNR